MSELTPVFAAISTRLSPPGGPGRLVARKNLPAAIKAAQTSRLTLIKAPAGYGKSVLMSQMWHQLKSGGANCAWIRMDDMEQDETVFLRHFDAALQQCVGAAAAPEHIRTFTAQHQASRCLSVLAAIRTPTYLFMDDFHALDSPEALSFLTTIINFAPELFHVIIGTRETPKLPLARWRALGQLADISTPDLSFTEEEATAFFALEGQEGMAAKEIAEICAKTEGWAAGLRLASLSLRGHASAQAFIDQFNGEDRDVVDFLAQDVLGRLPDDVRRFLMTCAVPARFSVALGDHLMAWNQSARIINLIEEKSLFLVPLDNKRHWYRFHHLFADYLLSTLRATDASVESRLNDAASQWFWENGHRREAVEHAFRARSYEEAAQMIDTLCDELFHKGEVPLLLKWTRMLPADVLQNHPIIRLGLVHALVLDWRFDEAATLLAEIRCQVDAWGNGLPNGEDPNHVRNLLMHREMLLAQFSDDMLRTRTLCHNLLYQQTALDSYIRATAESCMISAQREMYDVKDALRHDAWAREHYRKTGSTFTEVWHESIMGATYFMLGNLTAALKTYDAGLTKAAAIEGRASPLAALSGLLLAATHYELNNLAESRALLDEFLPYAGEMGFVDQLMAGYITAARLAIHDQRPDKAFDLLDEAERFAAARGYSRLHMQILHEKLGWLMRLGERKTAITLGRREGLMEGPAALTPSGVVTTIHYYRAMAWARLKLGQGEIHATIPVLRAWLRFMETKGVVRAAVRVSLILMQALEMTGDSLTAQRILRAAVAKARGGPMLRSFLDQDPLVFSLLARLTGEAPAQDDIIGFAQTLMTLCPQENKEFLPPPITPEMDATEASASPLEPLSDMERQILSMVGYGKLNREIADTIGLTEGSVKWYLHNVYNKLGVRRRSQAAQKARQFGMI